MNTTLQCIECSLHSFLKLIEEHNFEKEVQHKLVRELLTFLASTDYNNPPPVIAKYYHSKVREFLNNRDPYREKKRLYNRKMLSEYDKFRELIEKTDNPLRSAFKLAIAGNIIDFAPNHRLDIEKTLENALNKPLAIDDYNDLIKELPGTSSVLYIMDNAGEIVFDKLFIETLIKNDIIKKDNIVGVTRGFPVINDVTVEDAKETGLTELIQVIDTGDSTPGVILETSSEEFLSYFRKSDLIISKGQGNFESLQDIKNKRIYFLLITKCSLLAEHTGVPKESFVCLKRGA